MTIMVTVAAPNVCPAVAVELCQYLRNVFDKEMKTESASLENQMQDLANMERKWQVETRARGTLFSKKKNNIKYIIDK